MLDAAACGLPIVVNHTLRAVERIEGNGLTYQLNDQGALERVLSGLMDPNARKALGEAGARRMSELFSWEALVRRRVSDYAALSAAPRRRSMIRAALTALARLSSGRRYRDLRIGPGSQVDFWKLRAENNGLEVGARSMLSARVIYERPGARLRVGSRSFVGNGLMSIAECIEIGDDVMISWGSTIVDHHSHSLRASQRLGDVEQWLPVKRSGRGVKIAAVRIENRAWLGFNVSVLAGVTIGEGAVIGGLLAGDQQHPAVDDRGGQSSPAVARIDGGGAEMRRGR